MRLSISNRAGFTLIELLAGTTIFAIIMALLLSMLNSFGASTDIKVTKKRLEIIAAKAGDYYLSRENLPLPIATAAVPAPLGEVPLTAFHLDSKYRIDTWGNPVRYFTVRNDGNNGRPGDILIDPLSGGAPGSAPPAMVDIPQADLTATPPTGRTLITGIEVNNRRAAGILISSGPDNIFEYTQTPGTAGPPATPEIFTLDTGSDDIMLAIELTSQASRIAQAELKKLGEKVRAFDDRYIGKDNNGDGNYDEDTCSSTLYPGAGISTRFIGDRVTNLTNPNDPAALSTVCNTFPQYPAADYLPDDGHDYSCGTPTLDFMKESYCDISLGLGNCNLGYYVPNELQRGYNYFWDATLAPPQWVESTQDCGYIGADYFRVPMVRGIPAPDDCHWGLVGDPGYIFPNGAVNSELTNDQARASIFCIYGLSPADIVDPWLNGYPWGNAVNYSDPDPRFHKFFSAGPDQRVNTEDDIVAPL